jgi:hypothetical protein
MRTKVLALLAGLGIGVTAMVGVGVVQADKPDVPDNVPLHLHFFETANGEVVWVGPNVCETEMDEQGWVAYHIKVHRGTANENLALETVNCDNLEDNGG